MDLTDIAHSRLKNQHVAGERFNSPKELAGWMGALQAQDYNMVKWAMGIRLPGATRKTVQAALDKGDIIRTHLLRPTWHVVSADNVRWLLELTAPRIRTWMRSRHRQLGLTKEVVAKSNRVIERALSKGKHLTRNELVSKLENTGLEPGRDNRGSHLLLMAELDGIACSGADRGKRYTYALLDDRVPQTGKLTREEALAKLALTYFRSHGPATLEDFNWWSGLTLTDSRKALEAAGPDLMSEEINSVTYWFDKTTQSSEDDEPSTHLLPAYDECIISYRDRSAVIGEGVHDKAVSVNGIFRPVIVIDGQVEGIWKRTKKSANVLIEIDFFNKPSLKLQERVQEAAEKYGAFLGKDLEINYLSN